MKTENQLIFEEYYEKFSEIAQNTVKNCLFCKQTVFKGSLACQTVFLPAGDEKYTSFWPIDAIFSSRSGLFDNELLESMIDIIFSFGQNGENRIELKNGLSVPPYAICDHVNFDGGAVYFPGTYSSGEDQGNGTYGHLPPLNNLYLVCELVERYVNQSGNFDILDKEYHGASLRMRLENAFFSDYAIDKKTELCHSGEDERAVDWTYCDQVEKSGLLLVPSVMRAEACAALSRLIPEKKELYEELRNKIINELVLHLYDAESGWFYSSDGKGRQYDVWGTAYAVYTSQLPAQIQSTACKAILRAYKENDASHGGYVRHILKSGDFSDCTAWEKTISEYGRYMNGGYWATPSGWFFYALMLADSASAKKFLDQFLEFNRENSNDGAPYEWFNPSSGEREGRIYGTSGTSIFSALRRMKKEKVIDNKE